MEWFDKNGEFGGWISDDPDDWNTWSDYERKISTLVMEYNEEAFVLGEHQLGFDWYKVIDMIRLLSKINIDYTQVPELQERLKCIRMWADWRLCSARPDVPNEVELQIAEDSFKKADELWKVRKLQEAIELYEKAGLYNHPWAYERLGYYFEHGTNGLLPDISKAIAYYKEGADDGSGDCAFALGLMYLKGRNGLNANVDEACKWIRKAALMGACNAGNVLGECFEHGRGCERNLRKALYWYDVSQTGVENGDRLREMLEQSGETLPLRLDGFNYNLAHYIQDAQWWECFYRQHHMIID